MNFKQQIHLREINWNKQATSGEMGQIWQIEYLLDITHFTLQGTGKDMPKQLFLVFAQKMFL